MNNNLVILVSSFILIIGFVSTNSELTGNVAYTKSISGSELLSGSGPRLGRLGSSTTIPAEWMNKGDLDKDGFPFTKKDREFVTLCYGSENRFAVSAREGRLAQHKGATELYRNNIDCSQADLDNDGNVELVEIRAIDKIVDRPIASATLERYAAERLGEHGCVDKERDVGRWVKISDNLCGVCKIDSYTGELKFYEVNPPDTGMECVSVRGKVEYRYKFKG